MLERLIYTYLKLRYKNKRTVIYGAGKLCHEYFEKYDLNNWNILAVADKKYSYGSDEEFYTIKTIAPAQIYNYNPEVIFITLKYPCIAQAFLRENFQKEMKNTKIISLHTCSIYEVIKEFYHFIYKNKYYTGYCSFDEEV